jgi:uncharacterized protein
MTTQTTELGQGRQHGIAGMAIVDCDFHNSSGGAFARYLPERWQQFLATTGRRNFDHMGATTQQRPLACRLDALPPNGGVPGSDADFAREQLLDAYGISYAIMNCLESLASGGSPVEFEIAHSRAVNDYNAAEWLPHDRRWLSSVHVAADHPEAAAEEIERCHALDPRFVQVMVSSRSERPQGNPKYWPMFEAAERCGLPVAFHVANSHYNHWTGAGPTEYYYEVHTFFPLPTQTMVASMIFEGLFDRFPNLKIVCTELGWEWAVPLAWRMDASWRVLKGEVAHLQRKPSEYVRDHFWFSTQPCVETEDPRDLYEVYQQFSEFGLGDKLLFATDYPHWDMDSPFEAIPPLLTPEVKADVLARNAAALLGLELDTSSGAPA